MTDLADDDVMELAAAFTALEDSLGKFLRRLEEEGIPVEDVPEACSWILKSLDHIPVTSPAERGYSEQSRRIVGFLGEFFEFWPEFVELSAQLRAEAEETSRAASEDPDPSAGSDPEAEEGGPEEN